MRVVLIGSTGVVTDSVLAALRVTGHEVVVESPTSSRQRLDVAFEGSDAAVTLATCLPAGRGAFLPGAWRRDDRLRTHSAQQVVEAAREQGVRRLVQCSASFVYAGNGDGWITESSPLAVTAMTEPIAVAESLVQDYTCASRVGVVLRLGLVLGADPQVAHLLQAAHGRAGWAHVLHADDVATAVLASLHAPSGIYNVGVDPVPRAALAGVIEQTPSMDPAPLLSRGSRWLIGERLEPLARSLRVCSDHFTAQTGWRPAHDRFGAHWLEATPSRGDVTV